MMFIKTAKCLLAAREGCAEIYWLRWILLGLSVITLQLKALSRKTFEGRGGLFHISPMETEPKNESTFTWVSVKYPLFPLTTAVTSLQKSGTLTSPSNFGLDLMSSRTYSRRRLHICSDDHQGLIFQIQTVPECHESHLNTALIQQFFLFYMRKTRMSEWQMSATWLKTIPNFIYFLRCNLERKS